MVQLLVGIFPLNTKLIIIIKIIGSENSITLLLILNIMFMETKTVFAAWVAEEGKVNVVFDVNQTTANVFNFNQIKDLIGYNVEHSGWYMSALQYANVTFEGNDIIAIEPSKPRIDLLLSVL